MKKFIITILAIVLSVNIAYCAGTEALLFYNKALDYYKMGLYEEAISHFRKSIDADPEFIDAYFNLGSVYEFLQQYDEALGIFKQIVVRAPEDYDAVYHAAWLSYKVGEPDKAQMFLGLIPSDCARSEDAKKLYAMLGTSPKFAENSKPKVPQTKPNNLYDDIPSPTGIAIDTNGNILVAQFSSNSITRITPDGKKILYIKNAKLNGPVGITFDNYGNLYIANYNNDNILKVTPGGEIIELIKNVSKPYGITVNNGTLYVTMQGSNSVLKYKLK